MACRTARPKQELIRVVRTPDGAVARDPSGRLAGRGAYLCADASCWEAAAGKGAVARALAVSPEALRDVLAAGLDMTTTNETMTTTTGGDKRGEE